MINGSSMSLDFLIDREGSIKPNTYIGPNIYQTKDTHNLILVIKSTPIKHYLFTGKRV